MEIIKIKIGLLWASMSVTYVTHNEQTIVVDFLLGMCVHTFKVLHVCRGSVIEVMKCSK